MSETLESATNNAASLFAITNKTISALSAVSILTSAAPALVSDEAFEKAKVTDSKGQTYLTTNAIPDRLTTLDRNVFAQALAALQTRYPTIPFHVPQGDEALTQAPEGTIYAIQPVGARIKLNPAEDKGTTVLSAIYLYAFPNLDHLFAADESAAQNYLLKLHVSNMMVNVSNSSRTGDVASMPRSWDDIMVGTEAESRGMPKLEPSSRKTLRTIFGGLKSRAGYGALATLTATKDMLNVLSSDSFAALTVADISAESLGKVRTFIKAYATQKLAGDSADAGGYAGLIAWIDWADRVHDTRSVRGAGAEEEDSTGLDMEGLEDLL